jgi:hypothetical protein
MSTGPPQPWLLDKSSCATHPGHTEMEVVHSILRIQMAM